MENTKRRGFFQRMLCLVGGAVGATALPASTAAPASCPSVRTSMDGALRLHLNCRHHHHQHQGHQVCRGEILDQADGRQVGEFFANGFRTESALGANPFAASNIEMHTIRLSDGTLFGMGAASGKAETEKVHAILGGTGRFAGARGTYTIRETSAKKGAELDIHLLA